MSETPTNYTAGADLALLLAARDRMGERIVAKDAALRRALWLCEDWEITGLIDRVELQATLREIKAALAR